MYCIVKMLLEFNMFWTSADVCCKFICIETHYLLKGKVINLAVTESMPELTRRTTSRVELAMVMGDHS